MSCALKLVATSILRTSVTVTALACAIPAWRSGRGARCGQSLTCFRSVVVTGRGRCARLWPQLPRAWAPQRKRSRAFIRRGSGYGQQHRRRQPLLATGRAAGHRGGPAVQRPASGALESARRLHPSFCNGCLRHRPHHAHFAQQAAARMACRRWRARSQARRSEARRGLPRVIRVRGAALGARGGAVPP